MKEINGDLWAQTADVVCITTNGFVKRDGSCVMGRGCALEAVKRFPSLPKLLGGLLLSGGNHVYPLIQTDKFKLLSFPVKHNWWEKADIELIKRSVKELVDQIGSSGTVVLPRPGCGNGKLAWSDVKKIISPMLDDRFSVIDFETANNAPTK